MDAASFVLRSANATEAKDAEYFDIEMFKRCIRDAIDVGMNLSVTLATKFLERGVHLALGNSNAVYIGAWNEFAVPLVKEKKVLNLLGYGKVSNGIADSGHAFSSWALTITSGSTATDKGANGLAFVEDNIDPSEKDKLVQLQKNLIVDGVVQIFSWDFDMPLEDAPEEGMEDTAQDDDDDDDDEESSREAIYQKLSNAFQATLNQ